MSCCCTLIWSALVSEQLLPLCSIGRALVSNNLHPNLTYFNSKSLGIPSVSSTLGARVDLNQHIQTVSKQLRWRGEAKTMCAVILSRCETQCTPYMGLLIMTLYISFVHPPYHVIVVSVLSSTTSAQSYLNKLFLPNISFLSMCDLPLFCVSLTFLHSRPASLISPTVSELPIRFEFLG